ncbi:hypothetical protein ACQPZP_17990 [Spirillospora sp. CA-142024]|uniref:hypothetical protein n=1 Tax=Spirillospora sp. CA-142024 TaxID=3240036 RepID=UPI003D92B22D
MIETVYRTKDFPVAERFDYWHQWMSQTHSPVEMTSEYSANFRACTRVLRLGDVIIWPSHVQPLVSRRTADLIRFSDPETYNLTLILEGMAGAAWSDREAQYGVHGLHGQNSSVPCTVWVGRDARTWRCRPVS